MTFSRDELENLTIGELQALCTRYGIKPFGKGAQKQAYVSALIAFPKLAISQTAKNEGLKSPTLRQIQELSRILDNIGEPTKEQQALIRLSLEGRKLENPYRKQQDNLLAVYVAKGLLEDLIKVLMMC